MTRTLIGYNLENELQINIEFQDGGHVCKINLNSNAFLGPDNVVLDTKFVKFENMGKINFSIF